MPLYKLAAQYPPVLLGNMVLATTRLVPFHLKHYANYKEQNTSADGITYK